MLTNFKDEDFDTKIKNEDVQSFSFQLSGVVHVRH